MRRFSLFLFAVFALGCLWLKPDALLAQASVNVDNLDPVYRDVDKLVAHGLVDKIIMGQRPWSRREFARITGEAMRHRTRLQDKLEDPGLSEEKKEKVRRRLEYVDVILSRLQDRFQEELVQLGFLEGETQWYSVHLLEQADFDLLVNNSLPRTIPTNVIGEIDAVINPLVQYRQGRHIVDGANLSLETVSWLRASNHFAVLAQPRFQLGLGRDGQPDDNNVYVQNLYAKFYVKNFEVEVGRDQVFYGQGQNAGLLLSNNPRGLDMIKISNDVPGFLPKPFRWLGAHKLSFFFADLGPEQNFPNAYLAGWKWSLQPVSFFELGASLVLQSGGQGSPSASFGERVADFFPLVDFFIITDKDFLISNKLSGFDLRFRIPPALGMEIYAEGILDDFDTARLKSVFWEDAAYIFGFYFPRLVTSGEIDLRLEYHHTGLRFYEHSQFNSGWTLNQFIIGDQLGPNGNAGYITVNWDINDNNLMTFDGAFEQRSNDQYISVEDPIFRFVKTKSLPKENRYRGVVSWQSRIPEIPMILTTRFGAEWVQNFNFISGNDRTNFLGELLVQIFFDRKTRFPQNYQ